MRILSNCHTHTTYCDGASSAEEMVLAAIDRGFLSLGFTSHAPQKFDFPCAIRPEREQEYIREIRALQDKYSDRIRVYCGIERDLFSCADPSRYDYYLAAVHYFPCGDGFAAVDGSRESVLKAREDFFGGDGLRMAWEYYSLLAAYVRAYRPPVVAHFDLIRKNNASGELFDENDPAYLDMAVKALRVIREAGSLLEVNTGGMARGFREDPYPSPVLLRAWREMDGEVTVSSDCHNAKNMDFAFDMVPGCLREAGYDHIHVLSPDGGLFEKVPLSAPSAPERRVHLH